MLTPDAVSPARHLVLDQVAALIPARQEDACTLVGIDGPDGSGKTVFADQLADAVRATGRPVVRISLDDFHHPRTVRHRLGPDSPWGFWLDSYDYPRFLADVLDPLGPRGDRRYRLAAHDLTTDQVLDPPWHQADPGSAVIVDGLFLHRDELVGRWDFTVFLDVPFAVTAARMTTRDGTPADPGHPAMRRYVDGQRIYYAECSPQRRATVVVDNADADAPEVKPGSTSPR